MLTGRRLTGRRVRRVRLRLGETQVEFARRFRVDQSTISRWEADELPVQQLMRATVEEILSQLECVGAAA